MDTDTLHDLITLMSRFLAFSNGKLIQENENVKEYAVFDIFRNIALGLNEQYSEKDGHEHDERTLETGTKMWMHLLGTLKELCLGTENH